MDNVFLIEAIEQKCDEARKHWNYMYDLPACNEREYEEARIRVNFADEILQLIRDYKSGDVN